ncbi:MAG: DNA polymerase I [candidate division WS2 bacterium]|nr:DNA polymerase I [Candidatus Psychracetigena formicireducens]
MFFYYGHKKFSNRQEILTELMSHSPVAIDTEGEDSLLGLAIAWSPEDAIFVTPDDQDIPLQFLSSVPCIFHNCLWDVPIIQSSCGIVCDILFDTMLAAQACGFPPALGTLSLLFNFNHKYITDLLYTETGAKKKKDVLTETGKRRKSNWTLNDCDMKDIATICCGHAQATYKLWDALKDKVPESYILDMKLIPLLMGMHQRGIRIDTELAQERYKSLSSETEYLRMLCGGMGFNPGSPKQVGLALNHEGFMTYLSGTGMMVTDEEALLPLLNRTPIVPLVLRYREKNKILSTYIKPLLNVSRVYPKYHIVRTGRFASVPNIQNIPDEQRDLYLPDEEEFFWDVDCSQIEPRLMAWFSGDKRMTADVSMGDIYQPIADRYSISRNTAKQLLLASSYGAGAEKLMETSSKGEKELSLREAQELLSMFYSDYSRFKQWQDEIRKESLSRGYILTMLGRKRTLESMMIGEEYDYNPSLKACNSIIQGSAADILKMAMLRLEKYKISATIHDELLLSVTSAPDIHLLDNLCDVPMKWNKKQGKNWKDLT